MNHPTNNPSSQEPADSAVPATRAGIPRETLAGDRLCMRCLQPLAGRAIERDADTGLLFVRCGECGTPSALFEYPTLGPWLARIKSVAVGTLLIVAGAFALAMAGITAGFTVGTTSECTDAAGDALAAAWVAAGHTMASDGMTVGRWADSDAEWLATDAGQLALANARWSPIVLVSLASLLGLASLLLLPLALFAGVALTARASILRAVYAALPVLLGGSLGAAIWSIGSGRFIAGGAASWTDVAVAAHGGFFKLFIVGTLAAWCAVVAMLGPSIAAGLARLVLPPRDRRLVAWLWEWRGKRVPNR